MTEQLTKREQVAAMVLQGMAANSYIAIFGNTDYQNSILVEEVFSITDEFLRQSPDNDPNDLPH